jgi:hypothetical protein
MNHADRFRYSLADGRSRDDALAELRRAGASPFDCIRAIHHVEGVGLATAKRLLSESTAWRDVVDRRLDDQISQLESLGRDVLAIVEIGRETSSRGAGLSLREALSRTRYRDLRPLFNESDVLAVLKERPVLVEQWLSYSEDKRTKGGWYVLRSGLIGQVGRPSSTVRFSSIAEAVAAYIVRELDFWASITAG